MPELKDIYCCGQWLCAAPVGSEVQCNKCGKWHKVEGVKGGT